MAVTKFETRRLDIVIRQGATFIMPARVRIQDGSVPDLTGWTGEAQIKASTDDVNPILTLAVALGHWGTGDGEYNIEVVCSANASALVDDWGGGYWQLEVTDDFGNVGRLFEGRADMSPQIVR